MTIIEKKKDGHIYLYEQNGKEQRYLGRKEAFKTAVVPKEQINPYQEALGNSALDEILVFVVTDTIESYVRAFKEYPEAHRVLSRILDPMVENIKLNGLDPILVEFTKEKIESSMYELQERQRQ